MPASTAPWGGVDAICIDASIVVSLVTRGASGSAFTAAWRQWHQAGMKPVAPSLLMYEVVNALHRYVHHGMLLPEEANDALDAIVGLGIELRSDVELHPRALELAGKLGLAAAYDAHYLALAERLGAEFWTADRRLQQAVGATLPWVRLLEA